MTSALSLLPAFLVTLLFVPAPGQEEIERFITGGGHARFDLDLHAAGFAPAGGADPLAQATRFVDAVEGMMEPVRWTYRQARTTLGAGTAHPEHRDFVEIARLSPGDHAAGNSSGTAGAVSWRLVFAAVGDGEAYLVEAGRRVWSTREAEQCLAGICPGATDGAWLPLLHARAP